ncbi:MAG: MBL fold metallo-hydrolase [Acidimicrobiales bacterium]
MLDLGTGLQFFAATQPTDGSFRGSALLTHMHWDHVQGLPFFPPVDRAGARFDIYAPAQNEGTLAEVFGKLVRPPYFPVHLRELRGDIAFHEVSSSELGIGFAKVKARPVPHLGPTVGYRVSSRDASVAYLSDHQQPVGLSSIDEGVLELCDGVDLLIHDAQYTAAEFAQKSHWGHCTVEYAVKVAKESGAHRLALFHHDPTHGDDQVDHLLEGARCLGEILGVDDIVAAAEGLVIELAAPPKEHHR